LLDQEKCWDLLGELKEKKFELEDEVHERFVPRCKAVKEVHPKIKRDGTTSMVGLKYLGDDCLALVGGPHTRVDFPEFNLGSRKQIGEYLQWFGWKPTVFTEGGQPKVDEKTLAGVDDIPEAQLIADYLTVEKRIAMVQSWLDAVGDDGRVHGRVNSNGAVTGRMTHFSPNMAQVTAGTKVYGKQMRQCWTSRPGYKIVGCDASGLELRMLAHYMNDDAYTKEVLEGDIHTANQHAAGLATRDLAKTFIYAFLYGAGDAKIGSIVGGNATAGRRLKQQFLDNTPALKRLRDRVEAAAQRGWLKGLDGRRIQVRSPHAALNTLLQGAGAVVMKQALVFLHDYATTAALDFMFVGNIHDEIQTEVHEDDAESFGRLAVRAIEKAGEHFNLRCPVTGEYKVGDTWEETH
jgi:DNA polymerase I-like protein with 3'-5' exonuclease and polymerase domains